MINNYGNCSNFKICNENEEFLKYNNQQTEEKDYRQLIMSTPPSNLYKSSKYAMIGNSTHNNIALFSCTPKEDRNSKVTKEELNLNKTNSFNQQI
jgi:hypothetical protein